jgi:GDP-L-fucose synthase
MESMMKKDAKIYVAGHRGLVGSAIVRKLEKDGYNNIVYKASKELDLRKQNDAENFFKRERPEYVFLAAAKVGGILANSTYTAEFIYDNIMIAANVINASYKYSVKKLLNLGSSCIYPKHAPQPMKEEYLLTGSLEETNEPYAVAKISAIKLCRYYNEQYGTDFISVMPTNTYGPHDNFSLETAHVLPSILRKFYLAKKLQEKDYNSVRSNLQKHSLGFGLDGSYDLDNEESVRKTLSSIGITDKSVTIWGTGGPYREFLYVDDLADACVFLMSNYSSIDIGEFINIGTGKDLKIRELAEKIKGCSQFIGDIVWDRSKPDGMPRKLLDVSRIKKLGWHANIKLEEGIVKTYEWFES